jgi:hypothetical protein
MSQGVEVFDASLDSTGTGRLVRLSLERAGVTYARADHGQVDRVVQLDLRVSSTEPDGRILYDALCTDTVTDQVPRGSLDRLDDTNWPETRAEHPAAGWFGRVVKPAVIGAATAVGAFLFFSLRSRRTGDDG